MPLSSRAATCAVRATPPALALALLAQGAAAQDAPRLDPGPAVKEELTRAEPEAPTHPLGSPEYYVDARQGVMTGLQDLGAHIDLGAQTAQGEAYEQLKEEAEAIVGLMRTVPLLFPEGTAPADLPGVTTHAAPAIWGERERFDALWAQGQAQAEAMVLAGDGAELFARFEALENTCTACHAEFLAYDPFESMADAPPPDEALFNFSDRAGN